MKTQKEHLDWCKTRALQYVEMGDLAGAWASFFQDMQEHPETAGHSALMLGNQLVFAGELGTADKMKKFIEDFN